MDINLKEENQKLREQNEELKKLLGIAKIWIQREVKNSVVKMAKKKVGGLTIQSRDAFFNDNASDIITKRIADFFGEMLIINTPAGVIDNIISAELNYYNFKVNPVFDGFSVISSYHKALDALIEEFITKGFRSFVLKEGKPKSFENNALEKSLFSVVNKGYILSVGRLYHVINLIKNKEHLGEYVQLFSNYLKEYSYLEDVLLNEEVYNNLGELIESEVFGKKRHSGKINFVQTREVRELLIGDFKNKSCFIYKLIETQGVNV